MKSLKHITLSVLLAAAFGISANAQDKCDIDIATVNITKGEIVPEAVGRRLEAKLSNAMAKAGLTSVQYDSRFFVAGRFDDAINDITGGPSPKVIIKTTLTLYIGDADEQKVFDTETFDLKGVGSNDQQAYSNALNSINGNNARLIEFLQRGKDKIIDYYNANYGKYLDKARKEMASRNYEAALYNATLVPTCCVGYDQAEALALQIYDDSLNFDSANALAKAKAAWGADPTATGAEEAHMYLKQIDPSSSSYAEAKKLSDEISKMTQKQWEFENITKFKEEMALEKKRLDNEKAIEMQRIKSEENIAKAKANASRPVIVNRTYTTTAKSSGSTVSAAPTSATSSVSTASASSSSNNMARFNAIKAMASTYANKGTKSSNRYSFIK